MVVNQWLPAAHRGDAIGDSARRMRDLLRAMGHVAELYGLTIDDDLEGEVRPFRGDYRVAIDSINRFAESLAQQPNVGDVKVTKLPLNISPGLTLSGNTTDSREQAGKAEFTIIVQMKPSA